VFQDWNAAQLTNLTDTFNYLHPFRRDYELVQAPHPSPDFIAKAVFALPVELERRLRTMHQQFEKTGKPREHRLHEWLFWSSEDQFSPATTTWRSH